MSDPGIVKHPGGSLAERLATALEKKDDSVNANTPRKGFLLLDISGSMNESTNTVRSDGTWISKVDVMRKVVKGLRAERIFIFNGGCWELPLDEEVPTPTGDTRYAVAFDALRAAGVTHFVMVTDGAPNDPGYAMDAVKGLRIEFVYVGPAPRPHILDELAEAAGGTIQDAPLVITRVKQLTAKLAGLLGAGQPEAQP